MSLLELNTKRRKKFLNVSVNVLQVLKTRTSELSVGSSVFYIPRH